MTKKKRLKIGFIGAGNMGTAILAGICSEQDCLICEKDALRKRKIRQKYNVKNVEIDQLALDSDIIVLAVKPQDFDSILDRLRPLLTKKHLIVSIAAGITTKYIEKRSDSGVRVVRTMPNLPVQVGAGITAIASGKHSTGKDIAVVKKIFSQIGKVYVFEEKKLDAMTAITGSGPAYLFYFFECLQNAAGKLGIDAEIADEMVQGLLEGSLLLKKESREAASRLRAKVTSKGGTTAAALGVLEKKKMNAVIVQALKAATKRSKELSK